MSSDVYVERFHAGSQTAFSRRHFDRIFAERVVARDAANRCRTLGYLDGGGGDVYIDDGEEIGGFTVNRPGGVQLFDDLFQLMRDVGAVLTGRMRPLASSLPNQRSSPICHQTCSPPLDPQPQRFRAQK